MKAVLRNCSLCLFILSGCSTKTSIELPKLKVLEQVKQVKIKYDRCDGVKCIKGKSCDVVQEQVHTLRKQNTFYKRQAEFYNYILTGGSENE